MDLLPQTHIIRKQRLEVEVNDLAQSWEWQERLSRFANGPLADRLAKLFDEVSPPNEVVRLDKLELTASLSLKGDWEGELLAQIARQLLEKLPRQAEVEMAAVSPDSPDGRTGSLLDAFFHFLEKGRLPWWVSSGTSTAFEAELLQVLEQENLQKDWGEKFRAAVQKDRIRQRLVGQFSAPVLGRLAVAFLGKKETEIAECESFVKAVFKRSPTRRGEFQAAFWAAVFEKTNFTLTVNLANTISQHLKLQPSFLKRTNKALPFPEGVAFHEMAAQNPKAFLDSVVKALEQQSPRELFAKTISKVELEVVKNEPRKEVPAISQDSEAATAIFLRNAGMVVLHPFLPAFFNALKIAKQGKLLKPERAICLLQYLATGRTGAMEHELPLNKLLCGVPLGQPLNRQIRLTKNEKTEADNLLRAVVQHWSALGSTTPEGLRGTFLCREGKLANSPDGAWLLRVEQRSFDVLLADLPWSISAIKLPWMDGLLNVEWA